VPRWAGVGRLAATFFAYAWLGESLTAFQLIGALVTRWLDWLRESSNS